MSSSDPSPSQHWEDSTPFPEDDSRTPTPKFQGWNHFDPARNQWSRIDARALRRTPDSALSPGVSIVTWNIDAFTRLPDRRMRGVLDHIKSLSPAPNIIFLQEVSLAALACLLRDPWIRGSWFCSERDGSNWGHYSFMTVTLLAKPRFAADDGDSLGPVGALWRVDFPSRFGRDALCCDVFLPVAPGSGSPSGLAIDNSANTEPETIRVRLTNVHLDSLRSIPSLRPRQLTIVTSLLRSAGRGLVAGDFNPVLKEDQTLVEANGLVDVWPALHPGEPGFTWGIENRGRPYPPTRLDKVAVFGRLKPREIMVMHPGVVEEARPPPARNVVEANRAQDLREDSRDEDDDSDDTVAEGGTYWSDHSGLRCFFNVT